MGLLSIVLFLTSAGAPYHITDVSYAPSWDKVAHFSVGCIVGEGTYVLSKESFKPLWQRTLISAICGFSIGALKEEADYEEGGIANFADVTYTTLGSIVGCISLHYIIKICSSDEEKERVNVTWDYNHKQGVKVGFQWRM